MDQHSLAKPPAVASKSLKREPAFDRWPGWVCAVDLLQLLAEALTPTLPRGQFEASSRWAFYRYFWAFAPAVPGRALRLSDEASLLVDHHRTLASEQLGVGAALLVGSWLIQQLNPNAQVDYADADIVVDRGSVDAAGRIVIDRVPENRRMRPDYFISATTPQTGLTAVYALEAKGTHTPGHFVTQMKKGASQIASITVGGALPRGHVFSTELSRAAIVVRVLDPEGDSSAWSGALGDPRVPDNEERPLVSWSDQGAREVVDAPRFRRAIIDTARASLLAFAGQYEAAAERLPANMLRARDAPTLGNVPTRTVENDLGSFEVIEAELPLGQDRLRVRTGLDLEALVALREGDEARYSERREKIKAAIAGVTDTERQSARGRLSGVELDHDERGIRALRSAGSYLEVLALR